MGSNIVLTGSHRYHSTQISKCATTGHPGIKSIGHQSDQNQVHCQFRTNPGSPKMMPAIKAAISFVVRAVRNVRKRFMRQTKNSVRILLKRNRLFWSCQRGSHFTLPSRHEAKTGYNSTAAIPVKGGFEPDLGLNSALDRFPRMERESDASRHPPDVLSHRASPPNNQPATQPSRDRSALGDVVDLQHLLRADPAASLARRLSISCYLRSLRRAAIKRRTTPFNSGEQRAALNLSYCMKMRSCK